MIEAMRTNADILAQLALLGTEQNRLEDFLLDPSRGVKLMQGRRVLKPIMFTRRRTESVV